WLVLDEADRMLDMGFIKPVTEIARTIGAARQTALFSATMAPAVAQLAQGLLKNPVRVEAAPQGTTVVEVDQSVIMTPAVAKRAQLRALLADQALARVIVFARTKHGADKVAKNLALDGFSVSAIHGNKSQNARQAALKDFSSGRVRLLVATDIAARGIDVPNISHVINFDLPDDAENYVHRVGRTARNGATGTAITLCDRAERGTLRDVERLIRRSLPVAPGLAGTIEPVEAGGPAAAGPRPVQTRRRIERAPGRQASGPQAVRSKSGADANEAAGQKSRRTSRTSPAGKPWWAALDGGMPSPSSRKRNEASRPVRRKRGQAARA